MPPFLFDTEYLILKYLIQKILPKFSIYGMHIKMMKLK